MTASSPVDVRTGGGAPHPPPPVCVHDTGVGGVSGPVHGVFSLFITFFLLSSDFFAHIFTIFLQMYAFYDNRKLRIHQLQPGWVKPNTVHRYCVTSGWLKRREDVASQRCVESFGYTVFLELKYVGCVTQLSDAAEFLQQGYGDAERALCSPPMPSAINCNGCYLR